MKRMIVIGALAALVAAFFYFGLHRHLAPEGMQAWRGTLATYYAAHGRLLLGAYVLAYLVVAAFFLPGTCVLNLAAPGIFGFWPAVVAICLARAAGSCLACIVSRYALGDWRDRLAARLGAKPGGRLETVHRSIETEGPFYLFILRTVPGLPFPVTNMAVGLSRMRLAPVFWVTLAASLPGTMITANATSRIATADSLSGVFSAPVVLSLVLLALAPLALRRLVALATGRAL